MRRRLLLLGAGLLLTTTADPAEEATGARIRVEPSRFDFGRVLPRRTLRKEFRLRNLGDQALVIGRISRSCGCTGAIIEETTVEPGGSTPLRIWLETRDRSGPIEERVVVRSNDPRTPLLELLLEATVVEETPP
ncbi:MAG: DUF1573 domain-containing protein [Acidobacteriota bacterium]|jgi:hypothetical protein